MLTTLTEDVDGTTACASVRCSFMKAAGPFDISTPGVLGMLRTYLSQAFGKIQSCLPAHCWQHSIRLLLQKACSISALVQDECKGSDIAAMRGLACCNFQRLISMASSCTTGGLLSPKTSHWTSQKQKSYPGSDSHHIEPVFQSHLLAWPGLEPSSIKGLCFKANWFGIPIGRGLSSVRPSASSGAPHNGHAMNPHEGFIIVQPDGK